MTSSLVEHPSSSCIWYLLVYDHRIFINIPIVSLGNTNTHIHTLNKCLVGVNPYVCEVSGLYRYQSEAHLLMGNRHADREAVLLHTGSSKKARPWLASSASSPGQRTDGGRKKWWSSSGSLPCHSSTDALFIYWKNKSEPAQAPPLISCSLTVLTALFSIPPTGPLLMAILRNN